MYPRITEDNTPFIDILLAFLFILTGIIMVLINHIADITKEADIKTKAEYVITMTWDKEDDIDIWMRDPLENTLFFRQKDVGLMHLDRDDLGMTNDTIYLADGTKVHVDQNQEIVTIRGFVPGEWIVNIHLYGKKCAGPTVVKVNMQKLNPSVKTILLKEYTMEQKWEEITVARFTMTPAGDIISWDNLPISLVLSKTINTGAILRQ